LNFLNFNDSGPKQKFPSVDVPQTVVVILRKCENVTDIAKTSVLWLW